MDGDALFSKDRRYRYWLTRSWLGSARQMKSAPLLFCLLNPSKAGAVEGDPTVTKCVGFAKRLRRTSLTIVNAYGLVSTDPTALDRALDAIGPETDDWILEKTRLRSVQIVVGWGTSVDPGRAADLGYLLRRNGRMLYCFGINRDGTPKHPGRIAYATPLERY